MKDLESSIHEAYLFLRKNNHTIPSDHLVFIKDAALEKAKSLGELSETSKSMLKVNDNLWIEGN